MGKQFERKSTLSVGHLFAMALCELSSQQLLEIKEAHDLVESGIKSILPEVRKVRADVDIQPGVKYEELEPFAALLLEEQSMLKAQKDLRKDLAENIGKMGKRLKMTSAESNAKEVCMLDLDFSCGATNDLGIGLVGIKKESGGDTVTVTWAIYAEHWQEKPGVRLRQGASCWEEKHLKKFLQWRLLEQMPEKIQRQLIDSAT